MKIERHPTFKKHFQQRIISNPKLIIQTEQRLKLFQQNSKNPILKDHSLAGTKKRLRSFSITGDIRIVYQSISTNHVILLDIGSHNQVY